LACDAAIDDHPANFSPVSSGVPQCISFLGIPRHRAWPLENELGLKVIDYLETKLKNVFIIGKGCKIIYSCKIFTI
jgi:hypothetical protein